MPFLHPKSAYPLTRKHEVGPAVAEAWDWLRTERLIRPAEGTNGLNGYCVLTRRGQSIKSEVNFAGVKAASLLPHEILHPTIADPVWRAFIRGDYDSAVFEAMRAVEVAVRAAAPGLSASPSGVKLMRAAFGSAGPLTDATTDTGEQVARMDLFAGAIGSVKNPQSHRKVNLNGTEVPRHWPTQFICRLPRIAVPQGPKRRCSLSSYLWFEQGLRTRQVQREDCKRLSVPACLWAARKQCVDVVMERPPFFDTLGGGLWLAPLDVDLDLQSRLSTS
jgi:uncharacterized protein (TIGR02391 family)